LWQNHHPFEICACLLMKSSPPNHSLELASLEWDTEGQPLSSQFGDVYFSKANGLEETRHVFLKHNQLSERWAALGDTDIFTIAETGFGSGLNFLAAWQLWLTTAPALAQLHFVSVEKFPLKKSDLIRALALWPELNELTEQLVADYPMFVSTGFHRLHFQDGRIKLTLIIDDAAQGFTKLLATTHPLYSAAGIKVDAWFLDGFAPSKNPQMWSNELFACICNLSKPGTTAATFSAAAIVKNGLRKSGFEIQKVAGFGRKREMVKAIYTNAPQALDAEDFTYRGSFSPYPVPWTIDLLKQKNAEKRAIIIGGGLAGCHTARALAERGWNVTILERHSALAQEGSGNPQGVLYAKLSPMQEAQAEFNLASLQYALHFYRPLWEHIGEQCGVLQLAYKKAEVDLHALLQQKFSQADEIVQFVDAKQASRIAGISLTQSGLFFPNAGWIDPRKLCAYLVDHHRIEVSYNVEVDEISKDQQGWLVTSSNRNNACAPVVVIATAKDAEIFQISNHLPIKKIRGQVTYLPENLINLSLNTVVCAEGYIGPAQNGIFCTGATFNLNDTEQQLRAADHQTNLDNLREHLPALAVNADVHSLQGRAAFRCSLPDYLPAVGPLPCVEKMVTDFAQLRKNARAGITCGGSYWPGLYINIGHGARGLAYTPLCAELLAAQICDEPAPLARELVNALHPARFIIRDLTRNKR
jgi:tRNA 5-methylaminomethyl-2-thiouridine biosynthesis bifunctional protein